jgi:DNA repair protein RecN (Recombination protein N)
VGRKLAELARGRQVLCVTHLPQVAAFADAHLVVERTESTAVVTEVDGEARLEELSRMLAGLPDSEKGKTHAAELLAQASSD